MLTEIDGCSSFVVSGGDDLDLADGLDRRRALAGGRPWLNVGLAFLLGN